MANFSGHEKRVTLTLASLSVAAQRAPGLVPVLNKLPAVDFDLYRLAQADVEVIYASFDEGMEKAVKSEFTVDPEYLVDLKAAIGTCPLCGQEDIRWKFKIQNTVGGQDIECGSACIISHGLHVKGAETAAHARRVLEAAIRRKIRKNMLDQWHAETGFKAELFDKARSLLAGSNTYEARQMGRDLDMLERFYIRYGWIGTKAKWARWEKVVAFTKTIQHTTLTSLPMLTNWVKPKAEKKVAATSTEAAPVLEAAPTEAAQTLQLN